MGRQPERATLALIAERARVSPATVSKVVHGRADVAAGTRARVQQLLDEHRYTSPQQRADVVDLVLPGLDSPWAVEILRGVESYLSARGRAVAVSSLAREGTAREGTAREGTAREGAARPPGWAGAAARRRSAGVLLVVSRLSPRQWRQLQEHRIPLVAVDPADIPGPEVPSVGASNWNGGIAAAEHLLALGHTRIGVIGGPEEHLCSRARVDGLRHAVERSGRRLDPALVRWGDFRHEGGFRAATDLLTGGERPTALFAGSDQQALGVYEAARRLGLAVPGDLSVVGFDDLPLARWLSPPLTTVRQPLAEMGAVAAEMLDRLIEGRPLPSRRMELATELVVRESTAPPRR